MVFNETKKQIMKKVLKKIVKELHNASRMHKSQGDRINKLLSRKDNVAITTMMGKVKCKDYRSSVAKFIEPAQIVQPSKDPNNPGLTYSPPSLDPSPQIEIDYTKAKENSKFKPSEKDDNENTGRNGKGPKPMNVNQKKLDKELAKEQKQLLKNTSAAEQEKGQNSKIVTENTPKSVIGVDASGNPLKPEDVVDGEGVGNVLKEMVVNSK
jgi:hypothetical protein